MFLRSGKPEGRKAVLRQIDTRLAGFTLYEGLAPTTDPALRPGRRIILVVGLLGLISPFVALGIIGGAALQRCLTPGRRRRSEWVLDITAVVIAAFVFLLHPYVEALRHAQLDEARGLVQDLIDGRQLDLRLPSPPDDILIKMPHEVIETLPRHSI